MLPLLVFWLLPADGHDDHTVVLSIDDCPDASWSYREGRCYKLTSGAHSFDACNRVYCPALRRSSRNYWSGSPTEESTLACVADHAINQFIAGDLGGKKRETWVGLHQHRTDNADKRSSRQAAHGCASTFTAWRDGEPDDWAGCTEDCAMMGYETAVVADQKKWVDVDCGHKARCACEYPSVLAEGYVAPREVEREQCTWFRVYEVLAWASLGLLICAAALLTVTLRAKPITEEPASQGEVANQNPMIGIVDVPFATPYRVESGLPADNAEAARLARIVLRLILGFTLLNLLWRGCTWIIILSYGITRSASTWVFSVIGLLMTLMAAKLGVASVKAPNHEVYKGCGNVKAFSCLNWILVALYGVGFVISLLSLPWDPAYHDVVSNFVFTLGYAMIARFSVRLLSELHTPPPPLPVADAREVDVPVVECELTDVPLADEPNARVVVAERVV